MVLAYHLILSAYGFWLPNDPRGSWSTFVRNYELYLAGGRATKADTRKSLAAAPHDPAARRLAKDALQYPPVQFTGQQARVIAKGFSHAIQEYAYRVHACAILPDHVHLVVARHTRTIEQIRDHLKSRATRELNTQGLHPLAQHPGTPSPWARKGWHVFLDSAEDIARAIAYVEANPTKAGLRAQRWRFVVPYGG